METACAAGLEACSPSSPPRSAIRSVDSYVLSAFPKTNDARSRGPLSPAVRLRPHLMNSVWQVLTTTS